jgi:D-sedoheptulose 7-phosphate isomerase
MQRDWSAILAEHTGVLAQLESAGPALDAVANAILTCFDAGGRVYLIGNGGSAADAQHIAGELLGRFKRTRRALPAIALTTDTSTLTAVGNDLGFDEIFARQLEGVLAKDDILWILSTSGTSRNILKAADVARTRGAVIVTFTGQRGAELAQRSMHAFIAPHDASDRIQEAHQLAYHYICERVEAAIG